VKLLADSQGTDQVEFLTSELQSSPILSARILAAEGLQRRGSKAWIEPARTELERYVRKHGQSDCQSVFCDPFALTRLVHLLVDSGDLPALQSVQRAYPSAAVRDRISILHAVAGVRADGSKRAELADAILAAALTDDAVAEGMHTQVLGVSCQSPRVGDIAAIRLANRLETSFDCKWPSETRAARMEELRRTLKARPQRHVRP
jgi:hypothetical protein